MTAQQPGTNVSSSARVCTILGLVFGLVAILFLPILFGPAGIALGFVGNAKGDKPYGLWVGIGSIVTMIIGFILGAIVFSATN